MFSHISHHLETQKVLCEEQHGFRPNRSCETQLISTVNDFVECFNQGGQCDVCCWTSVRPLTRFPILIYVISYITMEFMVHFYAGFKLFYTIDLSM